MKKFIYLASFIVLALSACTEAESEKPYTVEDAKENGDVIVQHQSENFDQIAKGALDVENIQQINSLVEKVEQGKEASVDISIFTPNGDHYKNNISFDGEEVTFENNYGGYKQSPEGTFTCRYLIKREPMVYVSGCQGEDGTEYTTLLGFVGTLTAFKEAKSEDS
ncbi:hypothetical protein [Halobacillus litoralis]|uniref:DUF4362 domain-containing protein n=1 Tax=Halobacillus litoralis TaxID=45668 RepID=A0A410MCV6_9BACI|nr:hypothetical protein [Halobacillus litoralis]QAS52559.1 hypothetical protein HLI_10180 [Halobacillus litoralis]